MSSEELTKEDYDLLRAPFSVHAVRFRLGSWAGNGKYTALTYIDSRLVVERLSEVDPNWTATYDQAEGFYGDDRFDDWLRHHAPLSCNIRLKNTWRKDVGQLPVTALKPSIDDYPFKKDFKTGELTEPRWEISDKHIKALYSDALKRAAVQFGVGAYLYTLKGFEVGTGEHDKGFIKDAGIKRLKDRYQSIVEHPMFVQRFGSVRNYGDEISAAVDS